jgi:hypothetical protein
MMFDIFTIVGEGCPYARQIEGHGSVRFALTPLAPSLNVGYGVHTSLENSQSYCTSPPSPPILGGIRLHLGLSPPKFGGSGGQCRVERFQSRLEMYVHRSPMLEEGLGVRAIGGIRQ